MDLHPIWICRVFLFNLRGYYTEARRFERKLRGGEVVDAPLTGSGACYESNIKITLYPATSAASGLWVVTGTGSDSCSRVSGIYNPGTGRCAPACAPACGYATQHCCNML